MSAATMTSSVGRPMLSIRDVVSELGVSRSTVYRLFDGGRLAYIKIESRTLVRRVDLERIIDDAVAASPSSAHPNPTNNVPGGQL